MVKDLPNKFDLQQCIFCSAPMVRRKNEITSNCQSDEHYGRQCWINYDKTGDVYSACFKINTLQINFFVQDPIGAHVWHLNLSGHQLKAKFDFLPDCQLTEEALTKTIYTLLNFS